MNKAIPESPGSGKPICSDHGGMILIPTASTLREDYERHCAGGTLPALENAAA